MQNDWFPSHRQDTISHTQRIPNAPQSVLALVVWSRLEFGVTHSMVMQVHSSPRGLTSAQSKDVQRPHDPMRGHLPLTANKFFGSSAERMNLFHAVKKTPNSWTWGVNGSLKILHSIGIYAHSACGILHKGIPSGIPTLRGLIPFLSWPSSRKIACVRLGLHNGLLLTFRHFGTFVGLPDAEWIGLRGEEKTWKQGLNGPDITWRSLGKVTKEIGAVMP